MRYYIVADVHGFYDEMHSALQDAGFFTDTNAIFVSLGDLLDRGEHAVECLKFVNSLPRKILIRGNHEDLIEEALQRGNLTSYDWSNGTADTLLQLSQDRKVVDIKDLFAYAGENAEYKQYKDSLVDYYEDKRNIFVHGWIPCNCDDKNKYHSRNVNYTFDSEWRNGDWTSARWINGMEAWNQGIRVPNKTIFCGHWHTSWGHRHLHNSSVEWDNPYSTNPTHRRADFSPFIDNGIIALDACTAYSHKVNCYVLEKEE